MMQPSNSPPPALSSSPPSSSRGSISNRHRPRAWSEENTIKEEAQETFMDARLIISNNSDHGSLPDDQQQQQQQQSLHQFQAYSAGAPAMVRTGPLYLAAILFFTIPLFIMSVISTTKIPRPPSFDQDPRRFGIPRANDTPRQQQLQVEDISSSGQQQEQKHYLGRPYSKQFTQDDMRGNTDLTIQRDKELERLRSETETCHDQLSLARSNLHESELARAHAQAKVTQLSSILEKQRTAKMKNGSKNDEEVDLQLYKKCIEVVSAEKEELAQKLRMAETALRLLQQEAEGGESSGEQQHIGPSLEE